MTTNEVLQAIESAVRGLEADRPECNHSLRVLRRVREIVSQRESTTSEENPQETIEDPIDALLARLISVQRHHILSFVPDHARESVPDWCSLKPMRRSPSDRARRLVVRSSISNLV